MGSHEAGLVTPSPMGEGELGQAEVAKLEVWVVHSGPSAGAGYLGAFFSEAWSDGVAEVPEREHGRFRSDAAYIVVHMGKVYWWLGAMCGRGIAERCAKRAADVGGAEYASFPRVRECEGNESTGFLGLWQPCLEVVSDGTGEEGGEDGARLYHVKGRGARRCSARRCKVTRDSLNSGDCFVLDLGERAAKVVVWNGKESNRAERLVALRVGLDIRDFGRGRRRKRRKRVRRDSDDSSDGDDADAGPVCEVQLLEEEDGARRIADDFWAAFPEGRGPVASAQAGGSDRGATMAPATLYRVSDAEGGGAACELVRDGKDAGKIGKGGKGGKGPGPLRRDELDSDDCFVLDCGADVFAWIGSGATQWEEREAVAAAEAMVEESGRPSWTRVTRVMQGSEPPEFKSKFAWPVSAKEVEALAAARLGRGAQTPPGSPPVSRQTSLDSFGHSYTDVYLVTDGAPLELPEAEHGVFYAGECYTILFTYAEAMGEKEKHAAYCWLGTDSSRKSQTSAALLVKALCEDVMPGHPAVRVLQGAEPVHLLQVFGGMFAVRRSARPVPGAAPGVVQGGPELFLVLGADRPQETRAVQEPRCAAAALSSRDCFAVVRPGAKAGGVVWYGRNFPPHQRAGAKRCAAWLVRTSNGAGAVDEMLEGEEGADFWELLGGRASYPECREAGAGDGVRDAVWGGAHGPRLYCCTHSAETKSYDVDEEIPSFTQEDLVSDDVMVLDAGSEVFVWVGKAVDAEGREGVQRAADRYVKLACKLDGRSPEAVTVMVVQQGQEPPMFTAHFPLWDPNFVDPADMYVELREAVLSPGKAGSESPWGGIGSPRRLGEDWDSDEESYDSDFGRGKERRRRMFLLAGFILTLMLLAGAFAAYVVLNEGGQFDPPAPQRVTTEFFRPSDKTELSTAIGACLLRAGATMATWDGTNCTHSASGKLLEEWDTSLVTDMTELFSGASRFRGNVSAWNLSSVTVTDRMFKSASVFNGSISAWDVGRVGSMTGMFSSAAAFNADLSSWNLGSAVSTAEMFKDAAAFEGAGVGAWDVSGVTSLRGMFWGATAFRGDVGGWAVGNVQTMYATFANAVAFNANLSSWRTGQVTDMHGMFSGALSFNGGMSAWDVRKVTDMGSTFFKAGAFNQDLSAWDTGKVTDMSYMFDSATAFNNTGQVGILSWNVSSVTNSQFMFSRATAWNAAFTCSAGDASKPTQCTARP